MQTLEEQVMYAATDAVRNTLADVLTSSLVGYNKPLSVLAAKVIDDHAEHFAAMYDTAIVGLLNDAAFVNEIDNALRVKLARIIISKATGALESHVDKIKNDPTHKAELTIAVSKALKGFNK